MVVNFKWTLRHILSCILIQWLTKLSTSRAFWYSCVFFSQFYPSWVELCYFFSLPSSWTCFWLLFFRMHKFFGSICLRWTIFAHVVVRGTVHTHIHSKDFLLHLFSSWHQQNAKMQDSLHFCLHIELVCWINAVVKCNIRHPLLEWHHHSAPVAFFVCIEMKANPNKFVGIAFVVCQVVQLNNNANNNKQNWGSAQCHANETKAKVMKRTQHTFYLFDDAPCPCTVRQCGATTTTTMTTTTTNMMMTQQNREKNYTDTRHGWQTFLKDAPFSKLE